MIKLIVISTVDTVTINDQPLTGVWHTPTTQINFLEVKHREKRNHCRIDRIAWINGMW